MSIIGELYEEWESKQLKELKALYQKANLLVVLSLESPHYLRGLKDAYEIYRELENAGRMQGEIL